MIFIKIIISIAIFCITTYIGMEMASSLKSREEILTDYITFLRLVQNEMIYMANSLPVAFEMSRQRLTSKFKDTIGAIVVDMSEFGVNKVDMSITNNINMLTELSDYDRDIIISTLKNLGRSDIESQNNIIENAIKYSNDDGEIKIDAYSKGEKIYVDIFNSGKCIEEKELNKIWDRFYKSDKSRTNKLSTGLGLPIVRSILSQHNEDIWVKNIEGKGVSFIFTLKKSH